MELLTKLSSFTWSVLLEISIHYLNFLLATQKLKQAIGCHLAKVLSNCHRFLSGFDLRFSPSLEPKEHSVS